MLYNIVFGNKFILCLEKLFWKYLEMSQKPYNFALAFENETKAQAH